MKTEQFRCSLFSSKFMSTDQQRTSERLLVNCFADEMGRWQEAREHITVIHLPLRAPWYWSSIRWEFSSSTSLTDCPHKRRVLSSNFNHFPIMQMISLQKSSTPGAHQFSKASSLNTGIFFSLLHPPLPPSILLKRRSISDAKHWCSHCFGEGIERALTQSIYTTPFEEYAFFLWWEVKLYKCMGNTRCKK